MDKRPLSPLSSYLNRVHTPPPLAPHQRFQAPGAPTPAHASRLSPFATVSLFLAVDYRSISLSPSLGRPLERTRVSPSAVFSLSLSRTLVLPPSLSPYLSLTLSPVSSRQPRVAVAPKVLTYPHPYPRPDLPSPLPRDSTTSVVVVVPTTTTTSITTTTTTITTTTAVTTTIVVYYYYRRHRRRRSGTTAGVVPPLYSGYTRTSTSRAAYPHRSDFLMRLRHPSTCCCRRRRRRRTVSARPYERRPHATAARRGGQGTFFERYPREGFYDRPFSRT